MIKTNSILGLKGVQFLDLVARAHLLIKVEIPFLSQTILIDTTHRVSWDKGFTSQT